MAFYFALLALEKQSPRWAVGSVITGLFGVIFKYTGFPILGLGVGVTIWHWRKNPRLWRNALLIQIVAIILCAIFLFTLGGALELFGADHRESDAFASGGFLRVFDVNLGLRLINNAIIQINMLMAIYIVLVIVGSIVYWFQSENWRRLSWIALVLLTASSVWFIAAYLATESTERKTIPMSGFMVLIVSVAIVAIAQRISQWRDIRLIQPVLVIVVGIIWLAQPIQESWALSLDRAKPSTEAGLQVWSIDALSPGTMLMTTANGRLFNRDAGGYLGPPRAIVFENIEDKTLEEWRDINVYYAQLHGGLIRRLQETEWGETAFEDMLLLKRFPPEGDDDLWRGPIMYTYRLWGIENLMETRFGEQILLKGYDIDTEAVSAGGAIQITPYWQAMTPMNANYNVYIHLVPMENRELVAQADGAPTAINRPTSSWDDTDEVIIGTDFMLTIPQETASGTYRLTLGLYDLATGARLLTQDGDDFMQLTTIEIE